MPSFINGNTNPNEVHVAEHGHGNTEPMAIIGLAMRAADEATDAEAFWDFLLRARQAARPIPEDRLSSKGFYHPDPNRGGTFSVKGAAFLEESPNGFDAAFFKMSKTEVQSLDPQQRILMENVYHALENAGLPMEDVISSNTSVFVSGFNYHHADRLNSDLELSFKHKPTGAENSMISGRVSWFYDFQGASLTIDTACSSSLVGLHLARQSLEAKESEMAIVSGVSVIGYLPHLMKMSYSGLLGSEGKSLAFDKRAGGYGLGEGVGTVILKTLSAAVRDGDTIRAVVRGTGLNHDGHTPGMTYPSSAAQESLIRKTYMAAGLDLRDTTYAESHGTGTQAGDLMECTAMAAAFETGKRDSPFYIGAVKPNVGHLEGGAGITSLIKSVLLLEAGIIPPNATLEDINPKIRPEWNFQFPTRCMPWPTSGIRRSSISSYGISGTNAHCILDDAYHYCNQRGIPVRHKTTEIVPSEKDIELIVAKAVGRYQVDGTNGVDGNNGVNGSNGVNGTYLNFGEVSTKVFQVPTLFLLSAFDEKSLEKVVAQIQKYVSSLPSDSAGQALHDLAFTLSTKRSRLPWRSYALCNSVKEFHDKLSKLPSKAIKSRSPLRVGFVFTGQGAQYAQMGQQLLVYPVFRQSLEAASLYIKSLGCDWSLLEELEKDAKDSRISKSAFAHPLSCAVQIALLDLLLSWNAIPHRVVGHSSGEIAAAYCAGKISREGAWRVAYFRGHVLLRGKTNRVGGMLAAGIEEERLLHLLNQVHAALPGGTLSIACYNSPRNHTISGDDAMVDALKVLLDEQGIFTRKLKVEHAAHSAHMEQYTEEYEELVGDLPSSHLLHFDHTVHMFSTLTGRLLDDSCVPEKSSHWSNSMVRPVEFTKAVSSMCFDSTQGDSSSAQGTQVDVILEVGPHPAMQSAVKDILGSHSDIPYLATLSRKDTGLDTLLDTIGSLAARGAPVDLDKVNRSTNPSVKPQLIVNLPPYPFNHEERGLYESRLIKNTRLRQFPRHDLFGAPVPDWNPNSPRWRHFLRVSENPWLKEHVIDDDFVFPGAGYVVMAVEGMKQITDHAEMVGISLRDVKFKAMLVVPDDTQGVEVCLSFYPVPESKTSLSTAWKRFEVASYNQETEEWIEHCTGEVSPDFKKPLNPIDGSRPEEAEKAQWSAFAESRENTCKVPIDFTPVYNHLREIGVNHGPSFRNLANVNIGDREQGLMTGDIIVPDITELMPKQYAHEHLIHPTTLDNAFHASFASIYDLDGKTMMRRGCVPGYVRDIWLSTTAHSSEAGTILRCTSEASHALHGGFESTVHAWNPSNPSEKFMSLAGIRLSPFKPESSDTTAAENRTCYSVEWHPDLNLLTKKEFQKLLLKSPIPLETYDTQLKRFSQLQLASTLLATDGLQATRGVKYSSLEDHQRHYRELLRSIAAGVATNNIPYVSLEMWLNYSRNPALKEQLYREIEDRNPDGALLVRMGSEIPSILRKEITTQHLLFDKDNLFSLWDDNRLSRGDILPALTQYLTLLRKSQRSLRILDVGGRTGALAEHVLKTLCGDSTGDSIEQYVIGSQSADRLETLKKRLAAWVDIIKYETVDLAAKSSEQEIQPKPFDLVIANNFVRGQPNMEEIMVRLNSLTRPGGRLLVLEEVRPESLHANIIFGSLPGWWEATEASREAGNFADKLEWDRVLRKTGFSGIDFQASSSVYPEFADFSLMASTACHRILEATVPSLEVLVIIQSHSEISRLLATRLLSAGVPHSVCHIDDLRSDSVIGRVCISLLEAEQPILNAMDRTRFRVIQNLVTACDSLLWVTGDPLAQPEFQIATGLIRTIRWELDRNDLNLVTFSLDNEPTASADGNVDALIRVLQYQFLNQWSKDSSNTNAEYCVRDSVVETNHIVKNTVASTVIEAQFSPPKPILSTWENIERPVRLISTSPGVDSLTWVTDEDISEKPLAANEIEIDVHAVGLNFKDLLVAMGEIDQPGFGHEGAGIIVGVGSSVSTFKVGDRVMYLGDPSPGRMGTLRTRSRIHSGLAIKISDTMGFEIAAGLPIIYGTVIYSLGHVARLCAGEKVLIHAAAGGIGQAAIQYAQAKGAEIFVTLSSLEKKQFIMDNSHIRADHIFSSRDLNFSAGIKRIAPAGVDVVLNSLSGEALRESWACVAPFGRFVEIGKLDLQAGSKLDMTPFLHNVSFSGVDLNALDEKRPEICQDLLQETIQLWSNKDIHEARPTQVLGYGQLKEGLRLLQTGKSIGKITLVPGTHPVSVIPAPLCPLELDSNASFILAGGLGGIGRSIALRLARRGAKHLIFLSRSATVHEAGQETIAQLKLLGCTSHVFQCDISDESRLLEVITQIQETLPPVKGCIQCSFVLNDRAFDSMTHEEWQTALAPKVSGSWNLHCLLPDVDFFLLLSSITGIVGNRSQANYNAGNNFQDALARHRVSKGMHGASVNLGAVVGIGFIAENAEYAGKHTFKMANPQTEEEVLATIEYLIDRRHHTTLSPDTAQLVCGLRTRASYSLGNEAQPTHLKYPMFAQLPPALSNTGTSGSEIAQSATHIRDHLQSATASEDAARIIHKAVRRKMADLLNIPEDSIDDSLNVRANGVDSLIEMEFRTWFDKELGATVPLKDLAKDLTQLSARLVSLSSFTKFR
ncbi:putative polyketide synthase [Aspergillus clavatus NRRL 1]|uniref:Polyketide synthase, putative n=1 Tax=Aspergillus clavatus (strain ATCC 1007 / CBS 513.65 / DSM 816 / NCTC 3887 / NRRL 1 / QM 1276 / 107) TaxID=344612 RepID=A1C588_ASPCL|nr:polyketide synthase, putative [Aspergillus clavatus NRRL 1]EAW14856.1 polyketide synthase, putative [Aspergillus clavatus NRRL 1]